MATIQPPTSPDELLAGGTRPWVRHRVKVRPSWASDWQPADYLECLSFTQCASPGVPQAVLEYHAGSVLREDKDTQADYPPLELDGWFVSIELLAMDQSQEDEAANELGPSVTLRWVGIIQHNELQTFGTVPGSTVSPPSNQVINAFGLEHLLDMTPIRQSAVLKHKADDDSLSAVVIDHVLTFNESTIWAFADIGNSSSDRFSFDDDGNIQLTDSSDKTGFYVFDRTENGSNKWTVRDVVEYVVNFLFPDVPTFVLSGQDTELAHFILPKVSLSGLSCKEALDVLISKSIGFGWHIVHPLQADSDDPPMIEIFSIAAEPVSVGTKTLAANPNLIQLDYSNRLDLAHCAITFDQRAQVGSIIVLGERVLSCCSFSLKDKTLEKAWSDPQQTAYLSISGTTPELRAAARSSDELRPVFRMFRVPADWDFNAGNGIGGDKKNAIPTVKSDGSLDTSTQAPIRAGWGNAFERNVPLFLPKYIDGFKPDWREAIGFIKDPAADDHYTYVESASMHIRLFDNELGIELQAEPAHRLAKGTVTLSNTSNPDDVTEAKYDYNSAVFTLAFRTDSRLGIQVDVPITPLPNESDDQLKARTATLQQRELVIEVRDAELWYVVPGTAQELSADGGLKAHDGGTIRSDADKLQQVALAAKAWYGVRRAGVELAVRNIELSPTVGSIINQFSGDGQSVATNALVTSRTIELRNNLTSIACSFENPNFASAAYIDVSKFPTRGELAGE